jgi:hypothetical protein
MILVYFTSSFLDIPVDSVLSDDIVYFTCSFMDLQLTLLMIILLDLKVLLIALLT